MAAETGPVTGLTSWYNPGYTLRMKTAVSIPDRLFGRAERVKRRLRISRSEVYQRAIEAFVNNQEDQSVTERLNKVYGAGSEENRLDSLLDRLQCASISREDW